MIQHIHNHPINNCPECKRVEPTIRTDNSAVIAKLEAELAALRSQNERLVRVVEAARKCWDDRDDDGQIDAMDFLMLSQALAALDEGRGTT